MIIAINGKAGSGKDTVGSIIRYLDYQKYHLPFDGIVCTFEHFQKSEKSNTTYLGKPHSNWQIKKFSGKLKQIVFILTGIPVEDLEKREVKDSLLPDCWDYLIYDVEEVGIYEQYKVRKFLQKVGTNAMRDIIHPNCWINALFADYTKTFTGLDAANHFVKNDGTSMELNYPNWIITDCRFENELKVIKDRDGICIRVNRDNCPNCSNGRLISTKDNKRHCVNCFYESKLEHESEIILDNTKFDFVIDNGGSIEELIEKVREILIKLNLI